MEREYILLSGVQMTPNARKIVNDHLDGAQLVAMDKHLPWPQFQQYLEGQICGHLRLVKTQEGKDVEIDAETAMNAVNATGTAAEIGQRYEELSAADGKFAPPVYKKLRLSRNDRVVAGVCGGIAEYFQIDAILVRVAFIVCCLIAGVTFWLYPILWLILIDRHEKIQYPPLVAPLYHLLRFVKLLLSPIVSLVSARKENKKETPQAVAVESAAGDSPRQIQPSSPERRGWAAKFFAFAAFVVMSVFLYLPATVVLLGGASFFVWGIFYPIIDIDDFRFSFTDLETPGVVLAGCAALFLACLFLLIMTFVGRLHFKTKVLGKNGLVITIFLVVISLFGVASAACMTGFQNQAEYTTTVEKSLALESDTVRIDSEQFSAIHDCDIKIKHVKILPQQRSDVAVRCILKARGESEEQARRALRQIQVSWSGYLPNITDQGGHFRFQEAEVEVAIPAGKNLELNGTNRHRLVLAGEFAGEVKLDMADSDVRLENMVAGKVSVATKSCRFTLDKGEIENLTLTVCHGSAHINVLKGEEIIVENRQGDLSLDECRGNLTLSNDRGSVRIHDSEGTLAVKNSDGRVTVKNYRFAAKSESSLESESGWVKVFLPEDSIPNITMENEKATVNNLLPPHTGDALLVCRIKHGLLLLAPSHMEGGKHKKRWQKWERQAF